MSTNQDDKTENKMKNIRAMVPKHHDKKLRSISKLRQIPVSRLVAIAVDNELNTDAPFKFDTTLPEDEHAEYTFADEAGKLLNFMKTLYKGAGLDILLLLRYDIGVPNKEALLGAFKECLDKGMIEAFKAPVRLNMPLAAADYFHYRIPAERSGKLIGKDAKEYAKYLKMKKKYEKEE